MSEPPALVPMQDGWALWPIFELRGAGFALQRLSPLHAVDVVAALKEQAGHRRTVSTKRSAALRAMQDVRAGAADKASWNRWVDQVRKGSRGVCTGNAAVDGLLRTLDDARDVAEICQARVDRAWNVEEARAGAALRATVQDPDFRRAVLLQNRHALLDGMDAWLRQPVEAQDHAARRARVSVAIYLERYTTKNDTVGFFGPVGWGRFGRSADAVKQVAGRALVDTTEVHLEPWAVVAVADALAEQVAVHLTPDLSPRVRVVGSRIHGLPTRSMDGSRELTPGMKDVIQQVQQGMPWGRMELDAAAAKAATQLMDQGVVRRRLDVAVTTQPQEMLRNHLARLPQDAVVVEARKTLDGFLASHTMVQEAVGDARKLTVALEELDRSFAAITGGEASRNAGQTYGSRTLIYANCRRDHVLELGQPLVKALQAPMTVLLHAARWFSYQTSLRFLGVLRTLHGELARTMGPRVPLLHIYHRLIPLFAKPGAAFIADARRDLEERFAQVLDLPAGQRVVELTSEMLLPRVRQVFAAPHAGMPSARHHCPDVLFAKDGGGNFTPVLGELHAGVNTLAVAQAVDMAQDREELRALYRRDMAAPIVSELQHEDYALCAHDALLGAGDFHLDTGSRFTSWLPEGSVLRLGDFDLVEEDGFLRCVHVDGTRTVDALAMLERMVRLNATTEFHLPIQGPHQPRVMVDGVVLVRESWRVEQQDIASMVDVVGLERFSAAQALKERMQWPRFLFARVPGEHKPLFVDLESPVSVEVLCRALRTADSFMASEMLPAPTQAWLEDARHNTYVSECRMVAVDPVPVEPIPLKDVPA